MNPLRVVIAYILAVCEAVASVTSSVLGPVADQLDAEQHNQGGQGQGPSVPPQVVNMPTPFAGESSEDFAVRFPVGLVCTVPVGLKYDPWFVLENNGVFTRGAWIPTEAAFTAPVG